MPQSFTTLLGKTVRYIAKIRGGGSALPGLFVEKIDPEFVTRTLSTLPHGVVLVSGTNGKTTTTKMIVELLESQRLRVFTNRTGSNFVRGVAAALLGEIDRKGLLHADIAVLELDEAHAVRFVKAIPPRYSVLLNVMRDQLDRFGEIDATARLLEMVAKATTDVVILNREDPRIVSLTGTLGHSRVHYFGLDPSLREQFPNDDDLYRKSLDTGPVGKADVLLSAVDNHVATFMIDNKRVEVALKLRGIYNVYNAAAALTAVRAICGKERDDAALITALKSVTPAFGRGETIIVGGQPLDIVLVKNPSGFRLSLESFNPKGCATMIAVNDNYADGRDMSWLWDVSFDTLQPEGVTEVSGTRGYDMALRLQYAEIEVSHVETNLGAALRHFIHSAGTKPKRIYCTYTAMLQLRRELGKITDVERVL